MQLMAIQADVASLPVVARDGKPLGSLSARVLLDVLAREHREDIHRIVGILHEREGAEHALSDPPLQRAALRPRTKYSLLACECVKIPNNTGFRTQTSVLRHTSRDPKKTLSPAVFLQTSGLI